MTTKRQHFAGDETSTAKIIEFLTAKGFKQNEDFDDVQMNGKRYLTFSVYDFAKNIDLDISLDFDPYMHIDETDDEIYYDYPVYVNYRDNDKCSYWFFSDPEFIEDFDDLQKQVDEYLNEKQRLFELETID